VTTPAPSGLIRPDTDPLPEPIALEGGTGQLRRAVAYSAPAGFRPLELDLYTPAEQPAPVIVFLHGGGWRLGSRDVFVPTWRDWRPDPFRQLVSAGFAVASVDYRLSGEAIFPAQLDDAHAAVTWLHTRAGALGIDPSRVVAWGESAGAHLAALLGLTGRESKSTAVAGVVDWYGPADLSTMAAQALPTAIARSDASDSRESLLIGAPVGQAPELARRASPVSYVHPEAPPFHIAHGGADRFVPPGQSRQLANALSAAGVEVEFSEVPGADHLWMGATDPAAIFDAAVGFARRVTNR
jgi:acetyl esterase/lipase